MTHNDSVCDDGMESPKEIPGARKVKGDLKGLDAEGLAQLMVTWKMPAYRADQMARRLYVHDVSDIMQMTDLPAEFRKRLSSFWAVQRGILHRNQVSCDGSQKLLIGLSDGSNIETVYMPEPKRTTLCISTQTGCAMDCTFCATARLGTGRDLTTGEIIEQVHMVKRSPPAGAGLPRPTHLVFMGMGEPLLNVENVIRSLKILIWEHGFGYASRRITVSTCGIVRGIRRLRESGIHIGLALSLNSPFDDERHMLMPKAARLPELLPELRSFAHSTGRRITLEYILFQGINDTIDHAKALAGLARTLPSKINIILYNTIANAPFRAPDRETIGDFYDYLLPRVAAVTLRKSRGEDISAACGQLAGGGVDGQGHRDGPTYPGD